MDPIVATTSVASVTVALGLLTTMIIGATELIKRLFDRDYRAATIIAVSALVGGIGAVFMFQGVSFALGVVTGLSASGIITGVQKIGTGTSSAPTSISRR